MQSSMLAAIPCLLSIGCASTTNASNHDANVDLGMAAEVFDTLTMPERPMLPDVPFPIDASDIESPADIVDALDTPDVSPLDVSCELDPPTGPPIGVGRSCGSGGAPEWQCQEVPFCGGTYTMGSTGAWEVWIDPGGASPMSFNMRMRSCDVHEAVARSGYVDAYEVTVARFRTWVVAGMPHPSDGERFFAGLRWYADLNKQLAPPTEATSEERVPGVEIRDSMCTFSMTPGANDNLPVNCVTFAAAMAFCWWDGKHAATEVSWEYLATNRGTTATPFGDPVDDARGCAFGDVGVGAGLCAHEDLPAAVGSHPMGDTRAVHGIHDLWGGVQEWVIGPSSPYSEIAIVVGRVPDTTRCLRPAATSVEGSKVMDGPLLGNGVFRQRGAAWMQSLTEHRYFSDVRTRAGDNDSRGLYSRSVRAGIRCMRWVPEPR